MMNMNQVEPRTREERVITISSHNFLNLFSSSFIYIILGCSKRQRKNRIAKIKRENWVLS